MVLKKPKEFLFTYPEKIVPQALIKKLSRLIKQRLAGVPVAYLTGHKEFFELGFYVDKNVLIPRPETEILVEAVLELAKPRMTIADIGTGSGCVAIALSKRLPKCDISATDISAKAIEIAKKNNRLNKTKVKFYVGNLLTPIKNKQFDIIAANLPYGWKQWQNNSSAASRGLKFEPQIALFTKQNGLYHYRKLFKQIVDLKIIPLAILCEFDPRQTNDFKKLAQDYFPAATLIIKKDLAKLNRILEIKL